MISVTTILDQFPEKELVDWKLCDPKKAQAISQEALRIGSLVDAMVQASWRKHPVSVPLHDLPVVNAWTAWQAYRTEHPDFFPSIVAIQEELTDGEVVGHPDFWCVRGEGWGTVSLKVASAIRPIYWTQEAAYAALRLHQLPLLPPPCFLGILRLDKVTARPEYQELTSPEDIRYEMDVWAHYRALSTHRQTVADRTRLALEQERLA